MAASRHPLNEQEKYVCLTMEINCTQGKNMNVHWMKVGKWCLQEVNIVRVLPLRNYCFFLFSM